MLYMTTDTVTHIEEAIPRPGYKWPWVLVIQQEQDTDEFFVWAVYSQSSTRPFHQGVATSVEQARDLANEALR